MSDSNTRQPATDPLPSLDRVQSEMASLRREWEHSQRLATLGTLAAGVAHEINNILTPALAYAHLAKSRPDDSALQLKAIDKSLKCIETATQIAQQMLDFAADRREQAKANVNECLKAALDCLARDPAKDRINLKTQIHADATVAMRPLALQQVLLNLLLNACAAMRGRGGTLKVTAIERSDGTSMITLSDTGPGIPEEIAGDVFKPFVTSKSSRRSNGTRPSGSSRGQGGSGLGLMICKRLVEEAGGTINLASRPNSGTTLTIVLPTAQSERAKAV